MTCPNCIETLIKINKPFGMYGGKKVFYKCPVCGDMEPKKSYFIQSKKAEEFYEMKLRINNNGNEID